MLLTLRSEIKAQYLFEKEIAEERYPNLQDGSFISDFKLGVYGYWSLLRSRSKPDPSFRTNIG